MTEQSFKKVRITLSALTRVEYTEVIEVPIDVSDEELDAIVNQRYDDVDGGEYHDDEHYWEQGRCSAEPIPDEDALGCLATLAMVRDDRGVLIKADPVGHVKAYAAAWEHCSGVMMGLMVELVQGIKAVLPEGLVVADPVFKTDGDEFAVISDVKNSREDSILSMEFKLADGAVHEGVSGFGVALEFLGYSGLLMGGYYPAVYTTDVFLTDNDELLGRVNELDVSAMVTHVCQSLKNPVLLGELQKHGISL